MAIKQDPFEGQLSLNDVRSLSRADKSQAATPQTTSQTTKPKVKRSLSGAKKPDVEFKPNQIIVDPKLPDVNEQFKRKSDTVYVLNGRMNPVTKGHEENVMSMKQMANNDNADHVVIATHSHDDKTVGSGNKNPLSPEVKTKHLRRAFPDANITTTSKQEPSIFHQLSKLHAQGYKDVVLAAGEDRLEDYEKIKQYNGQEGKHGFYNFNSIRVASTGERKPGVSGTDMRKYAEAGDYKTFKSHLPTNIRSNEQHAKDLFADVRNGMKVNQMTQKEETALFERAIKHGIQFGVLKEVYARGLGDWKEGSRTPQQYAFARVDSFIHLGEAYNIDCDLRDMDEAVDLKSRLQRRVQMAMHRRKIERAREIAMNRFAKTKNLKRRALKIARDMIRKRVAGSRGADYKNLNMSQKIAVDRMLDSRKKQIKKIAGRIVNKVRRDEASRLAGTKGASARKAIVAHTEIRRFADMLHEMQHCVPEEDHIYFEMTAEEWEKYSSEVVEEKNENRALNKPFRTPGGPKKFAVYVKNDKGNVIKLGFGDPNLEIKRDDPDRRKAYRARHGCDNPGPKWKANYWSCNWSWSSSKKVGA